MSTCKLSLIRSLLENRNSSSTPHLPKTIVIHDDPDEIVTIGRANSKSKVNYVLEDSSKPRVVSRLHATLRYNREDCSFSLTDQSVNGTYVNNVRVPLGGVKLKTEDIVCFFHRHGANIKPGEEVEQLGTHLKYRVEIVDDNNDIDEEEEIDDGDNRENDTSEKTSAAEDGGAVMLLKTSTSGSSSSTEESCMADELCTIRIRESSVPCDDKDSASPTPDIRDAEGAGAKPPEQHEREERGAGYSGRSVYAEQRKAENDAARAAAEPPVLYRTVYPGWCNSFKEVVPHPGSGGGPAGNKGGAGVGGPGGNNRASAGGGGNSEEVICLICTNPLEPEYLCGFGHCFDQELGHFFCVKCLEAMVDKAANERHISSVRVRCPVGREPNSELVLYRMRCTIEEFMSAREAFRYVQYHLEQAVFWCADPHKTEELKKLAAKMRAEMKLPDACLSCFGLIDLGRPYYGYQHCCAVHYFCCDCVLRHNELAVLRDHELGVPRCPVPGVIAFADSRLVMVDGNTSYMVSEALAALMREHHFNEKRMWGLLNPLNVAFNSSKRVDLSQRVRHLPYER